MEPYAMPNLTERGIIATVDLQWPDSGTLNQTSLSEFIRCVQKILSVNLNGIGMNLRYPIDRDNRHEKNI